MARASPSSRPASSSGPSRPATGRSPTCTSSRSRSPGPSSAPTAGSSTATTSASSHWSPCPSPSSCCCTRPPSRPTIEPLVPALQNNLLLTVHVAVAIVAYGSFTIAFGAAFLYLIQPQGGRWGLPKPETLDEIGYRAIVIGFPFLTLTLILGALWAERAWGAYWSWDPKETASLVTWLIYGAYLHARVVRGWRGQRAAWLLVIGFAATLFTYFGNLLLRRAAQLRRPERLIATTIHATLFRIE